jgi:hypothetical protein
VSVAAGGGAEPDEPPPPPHDAMTNALGINIQRQPFFLFIRSNPRNPDSRQYVKLWWGHPGEVDEWLLLVGCHTRLHYVLQRKS